MWHNKQRQESNENNLMKETLNSKYSAMVLSVAIYLKTLNTLNNLVIRYNLGNLVKRSSFPSLGLKFEFKVKAFEIYYKCKLYKAYF